MSIFVNVLNPTGTVVNDITDHQTECVKGWKIGTGTVGGTVLLHNSLKLLYASFTFCAGEGPAVVLYLLFRNYETRVWH